MEVVKDLLAPHEKAFDLEMAQMVLRGIVVYLAAIVMVRLGSRRFMGRNTAFDLLLGILLGSILSRGVTGQAPLWHVLVTSAVLLMGHWLVARLSYAFNGLGPIVKGSPRLLVRDGEVLDENTRRSLVGKHDLQEALRLQGKTASIERVKLAYIERSGCISVILKDKEPRVLEVKVEDGVQTVKIEIT